MANNLPNEESQNNYQNRNPNLQQAPRFSNQNQNQNQNTNQGYRQNNYQKTVPFPSPNVFDSMGSYQGGYNNGYQNAYNNQNGYGQRTFNSKLNFIEVVLYIVVVRAVKQFNV